MNDANCIVDLTGDDDDDNNNGAVNNSYAGGDNVIDDNDDDIVFIVSPTGTSAPSSNNNRGRERERDGGVEVVDVEALYDAGPRGAAGALPARGMLSYRGGLPPITAAGTGLLHQPMYSGGGRMGPGLGLLDPLGWQGATGTVSTAPRPYIPPYAAIPVVRPALLSFSLLNRKEFAVESDCALNFAHHKPVLDTLNGTPGVRYDPDTRTWICPLEAHTGMEYALHISKAVVRPLPRAVLTALSLSAQRRGDGGVVQDNNSSSSSSSSISSSTINGSMLEVEKLLSPRLFRAMALFQREGVEFALKNEGKAFIADEMGLGKTIQALGVAALYTDDWPVLVVCPSGARYHWKAEIMQWLSPEYISPAVSTGTGDPGVSTTDSPDIVLVDPRSPSTLPSRWVGKTVTFKFMIISFGLVSRLHVALSALRFQAIIVDESHYMKNPLARRTICLSKLITQSPRAVLLSGTPALSRPIELFSQLHALQPDIWTQRTEFGERYCRVKGRRSASGGAKFSGARNEGELHTLLLGTIMIRRLKADIMTDLPAKERIVELLDIDNQAQRRKMQSIYNIIRRHNSMKYLAQPATNLHDDYGTQGQGQQHSDKIGSSDSDNMNNGSFNSKHALNSDTGSTDGKPSTYPNNSGVEEEEEGEDGYDDDVVDKKRMLLELYMQTAQAKAGPVIERINAFLADPLSGKLVVFGHHRSMLDQVGKHFNSLKPLSQVNKNNLTDIDATAIADDDDDRASSFDYIRIDGHTAAKQRHENVTRFQTEVSVRVALLSITAAGVALTLTAASTVFFAELYWTPGSLLQAEDRVHRIGQAGTVKVHYLLAKDSIDEILWPLVRKKIQTLGHIFDGHEGVDFHLHKDAPTVPNPAPTQDTSKATPGLLNRGINTDEDIDIGLSNGLEGIINDIAKTELSMTRSMQDRESESDGGGDDEEEYNNSRQQNIGSNNNGFSGSRNDNAAAKKRKLNEGQYGLAHSARVEAVLVELSCSDDESIGDSDDDDDDGDLRLMRCGVEDSAGSNTGPVVLPLTAVMRAPALQGLNIKSGGGLSECNINKILNDNFRAHDLT